MATGDVSALIAPDSVRSVLVSSGLAWQAGGVDKRGRGSRLHSGGLWGWSPEATFHQSHNKKSSQAQSCNNGTAKMSSKPVVKHADTDPFDRRKRQDRRRGARCRQGLFQEPPTVTPSGTTQSRARTRAKKAQKTTRPRSPTNPSSENRERQTLFSCPDPLSDDVFLTFLVLFSCLDKNQSCRRLVRIETAKGTKKANNRALSMWWMKE